MTLPKDVQPGTRPQPFRSPSILPPRLRRGSNGHVPLQTQSAQSSSLSDNAVALPSNGVSDLARKSCCWCAWLTHVCTCLSELQLQRVTMRACLSFDAGS